MPDVRIANLALVMALVIAAAVAIRITLGWTPSLDAILPFIGGWLARSFVQ